MDGRARGAAAREPDLAPPDLPPPDLMKIDTERGRKRRGKSLIICVAALGVICAALGLYAWSGGRASVSYQIAEKKIVRQAQAGFENEPANQMTSDAINQAKEELRKAGAVAAPGATSQASGVAAGGDRQASSGPAFTPYIVPDTPIVTGARDTPVRVAGQAGSETAGGGIGPGAASVGIDRSAAYGGVDRGAASGGDAGQTYYHSSAPAAFSIYALSPERKTSSAQAPARSPRVESGSAAFALAPASVKLPPFGAMLPARTLGAFYTFRNASLARLELTRDLSGDGWSLKRGAVLIAQSQGSVNDRAFMSLVGFIDPDTNRLIRLAGDVLGSDGGPGLKGKKRKIGGALAPVLNRLANGALAIGQAALSRGGTTVIAPGGSLTGYGNDFGLSQSAVSRREFVEVPAGAPAYVLVTDLPKEVKGVDADPIMHDRGHDRGHDGGPNGGIDGGIDGGPALTDEELADLLSNGAPERIREALPRMPPEMRKVAELALGAR